MMALGIPIYVCASASVPIAAGLIHSGRIAGGRAGVTTGHCSLQWLYPRTPVYTWRVPGLWFDIGSKETLEQANRIFAKL